jgi:pimeloyl-ACP methyl ester carboxylesterase
VNVRTLAGVQGLHAPREIAGTGVPLLLLVGADDALFPAEAVRAVHGEIPGSAFVELPEVGHSAYFEAPDEFTCRVLQWLKSKVAIES